jgi:hypothetical protein
MNLNSPSDQEASFGNKRTTTRTGYSVHAAETCKPGQANLITEVQANPAGETRTSQLARIARTGSASRNSRSGSLLREPSLLQCREA